MSTPLVLLLSIIAAAIPTLFFVGLIYWVDRYEKEPFWLLTAVYFKTLHFYQQCSTLAYKKHHYMLFQHEKDAQRIVALQNELFYLGKEIAEKTL